MKMLNIGGNDIRLDHISIVGGYDQPLSRDIVVVDGGDVLVHRYKILMSNGNAFILSSQNITREHLLELIETDDEITYSLSNSELVPAKLLPVP